LELRPDRTALPEAERVLPEWAERAVLPEAERAAPLETARVATEEREAPDERGTTEERVEAPEPDRDLPTDLVARESAALREAVRPRDTMLWEAAPRVPKLPSLWPSLAAWLRCSRGAPPI
jgi:hypothetical protein